MHDDRCIAQIITLKLYYGIFVEKRPSFLERGRLLIILLPVCSWSLNEILFWVTSCIWWHIVISVASLSLKQASCLKKKRKKKNSDHRFVKQGCDELHIEVYLYNYTHINFLGFIMTLFCTEDCLDQNLLIWIMISLFL